MSEPDWRTHEEAYAFFRSIAEWGASKAIDTEWLNKARNAIDHAPDNLVDVALARELYREVRRHRAYEAMCCDEAGAHDDEILSMAIRRLRKAAEAKESP